MEEILRPFTQGKFGLQSPYPSRSAKHLNAIEHRNAAHRLAWRDYYKFSFVRNPWGKMLSYYLLKKRDNKDFKKQYRTFDDWIKSDFFTLKLPYMHTYRHRKFTNQIDWLTNERGQNQMNFVGRFETIAKDWATVAARIGVDRKLPHTNKTSHDHYSRYYDDESIEIVRKLFEKDIAYFRYEFEEA